MEKGEKYHIMECYLDKKKIEMMNVLMSVVLSHFHMRGRKSSVL